MSVLNNQRFLFYFHFLQFPVKKLRTLIVEFQKLTLLNCDIPSQIEETKAVIDEMCDISSNVISLVACRMHKVLVKITQYFSKNPSLTSQQEKGLQM